MTTRALLGILGCSCFSLLLAVTGCGDNLEPNAADGPPPGPDGPMQPDANVDAAPNPEICDDTIDNDGDGQTDCADTDCAAFPACNPEVMCNDTVDNDGDGATDCADSDCATAPNCSPEGLCTDGTDNDLDGDTDCADSDCAIACLLGCADNENVVSIPATGLPVAILDNATADLTFDVPADGWLANAAIRFTITHTYDGDLDIALGTPSSGTLDLSTDNGGAEDNYTDTILVDSATTAITAGAAPFTGLFQPEQAFSTRAGAPTMGTWHITVGDDATDDQGSVDAMNLYLCVCNGTAGCETNLACTDGEDNDGDGAIDCADGDCAAVPQCIPETNCTDGVDNDLDGQIDCADTDCGITCAAEVDCNNGIDDDGDGFIDCLDVGCNGIDGCEFGGEVSCVDGIDNDGDGAVDCADSQCANLLECAVTCPVGSTPTVYTATDVPVTIVDNNPTPAVSTITVAGTGLATTAAVALSIDHNYDGDVDITFVSPAGTTVDLSSDNGGSADDYTNTVFVDTAPTSITAGMPPYTGQFRPEQALATVYGSPSNGDWRLEVRDDEAGIAGTVLSYRLLLCACDAAAGSCEFGPVACRNGIDDDGNGAIDCAEPACATDPFCIPETACADGVDNDFDGLVDCQDADCNGVSGCELATELTCNDAFDNDGDGNVDCLDVDCALAPNCLVELDCDNGIDDDGDGLIDCDDPSNCAADLGCIAEVDCNNGLDDDGDGNIDCLDQGCDGLQGCELGTEVSCQDGFDNDGDGASDCLDSNCGSIFLCSIPLCPDGTTKVLYTSTDVPKAIPDNAPTSPATVALTVPTAGVVAAAAVRVNITHPNDDNIDISLVAPSGVTRELSTDNGSAGDNYSNTTFTDSATTQVTAGTAPFSGNYRSEQVLWPLNGTAVGGTWTLRVGDDTLNNTGSVTSYDLLTCQCDPASGNCEFGALCGNLIDDDGDGQIDCADANCADEPACAPAEHVCNDGIDNDGDGQTDCSDSTCAWACTTLGTACAAGTLITYSAFDLPRPISVGPTDTFNTAFPVSTTGTIIAAALRFNALHTYDSDVSLTVTSPAGTTLDITSSNGSFNDNYINTIFVDTATTAITAGTPPFTGSYRPEQALTAWTGQPSNGLWRTQLRDSSNLDGGDWQELSVSLCVGP
jgi:subtilisin-like proprotein convertase family protein